MKNITRYLVFGVMAIAMLWLSLGTTGCSSDGSTSTEPVVEQPAPDHGTVDTSAPEKNPNSDDGSAPGGDN